MLILGFAAIALPFGLDAPNPLKEGKITEHLTELGIIISLMSAGLKIDRPPGFKAWSSTWRLLGITMILSITLAALTGCLIALFVPATAMLLGAMIGMKEVPWRERLAISFFGIRGIGSIYYLAYALNEAEFEGAKELWALVALVIVISIVVHGITASLVTTKLDELREKK